MMKKSILIVGAGAVGRDQHLRTYAVIAYLLTKESFLTILSSQNALILVKCVSPNL